MSPILSLSLAMYLRNALRRLLFAFFSLSFFQRYCLGARLTPALKYSRRRVQIEAALTAYLLETFRR
jgi:hypothetical protein